METPGFIDLQVNGFAGVDFNSAATPREEIARAIQVVFSTGVTRFFPTVITGDPAEMLAALRNLAAARAALEYGAAMEGFHVEGPHISPEDAPRGAHPKQWVRPPDFEEFLRWQDAAQGRVRIVTLAPEWPGATRYIEQITKAGVVAAIGHTHANATQIHEAALAGATLSTHIGNGAGSATRSEHFIMRQLSERRLSASLIVDHHHLPDDFLRLAITAKTVEHSILITDAVAPAMCPPGPYRLGSVDVELRNDGRVTLRGGERLAGSSLCMHEAIGNVIARAGVGLTDAIKMATSNPARVAGVAENGDRVHFELVGGRVEIGATYFNGKQVFAR
jgi:N-acetylglucosamine-6-phosphate deacetylase